MAADDSMHCIGLAIKFFLFPTPPVAGLSRTDAAPSATDNLRLPNIEQSLVRICVRYNLHNGSSDSCTVWQRREEIKPVG